MTITIEEEHPSSRESVEGDEPIELLQLQNEVSHSFRKVSESLGIPLGALRELASRRSVMLSESGRISHSSYLLLKALIPCLFKKYERADRAKSGLGPGTYKQAVLEGRLEVISGLGMELVLRVQLNPEKQFLLSIQDINRQLGEELMPTDYRFLFSHREGSSASNLTRYLKSIGSTDAKSALRHGWLSGTKDEKTWHIPFEEVLRAVSLARNWASIKRICIQNHINPDELRKFAEAGGVELRKNLSGALAMRICDVAETVIAYKLYVKELRKGVRSFQRFARRGEMSTQQFAAMFGVSDVTVRNWIEAGKLKAKERKSCLFIRRSEVKVLAINVLGGSMRTSQKLKETCRSIVETKRGKNP